MPYWVYVCHIGYMHIGMIGVCLLQVRVCIFMYMYVGIYTCGHDRCVLFAGVCMYMYVYVCRRTYI